MLRGARRRTSTSIASARVELCSSRSAGVPLIAPPASLSTKPSATRNAFSVGEAGERGQRVDVDREVIDAKAERRDPRRVLALGEQRLVVGARDAATAARPTADPRARRSPRAAARRARAMIVLRGRRQLADAQLADEDLRQRRIGVLPVARAQVLVVEAIAIARLPAERLERPRERGDADARQRRTCAARRDRCGPVSPRAPSSAWMRSACGVIAHVVAPQRVEQLGDRQLAGA